MVDAAVIVGQDHRDETGTSTSGRPKQSAIGPFVDTSLGYVGPFGLNDDGSWLRSKTATSSHLTTVDEFLRQADTTTTARCWLRLRDGASEARIRPTGEVDAFWPVFEIETNDRALNGRSALPTNTLVEPASYGRVPEPAVDTLELEADPLETPFIDAEQRAVIARGVGTHGGVILVVDSFQLSHIGGDNLPGRFAIAAAPDRRRMRNLQLLTAHDHPKIASWAAKRALKDPDLPAYAQREASRLQAPRDAQKRRVYRWEERLWGNEPTFRGRLPVERAQSLVTRLWQTLNLDGSAPTVSISNRATKTSVSSARRGIVLAAGRGQDTGTVLHELGHEIVRKLADETRVQAHGPEFVGVVSALYAHTAAEPVETILSSAQHAGLRVSENWAWDVTARLDQQPEPAAAPAP